jgi:hypothetical protein
MRLLPGRSTICRNFRMLHVKRALTVNMLSSSSVPKKRGNLGPDTVIHAVACIATNVLDVAGPILVYPDVGVLGALLAGVVRELFPAEPL